MYFSSGSRTKARIRIRARVRVEAQKTTGKDEKMLFSLVKALTSLFLPLKGGLRQVYDLVIWLN